MEARQFADGTIYLYGSSDICGNDDYCSRKYDTFSSRTMDEWKRYPDIFTGKDSFNDGNFVLYAPDCQYINGKYCLFYCTNDGSEGVAFSDQPCGPFTDARPIGNADGKGIDPAVFVDDDSSVYYYWAQHHAKGGRLDVETWTVIPETINENLLSEEVEGFHEGSSVRKRNGIYYYVYADISRGRPTCLGYATADHPLGPYRKRGIIIDNTGCDPSNWNNHGCIAEIDGEWYVFYHRSTHNSKYSRQVCVERIHFRADGTIEPVEMTTQGIDGPIDCRQELMAYRTCKMTGGCYIDDCQDNGECLEYVTNLRDGDTCQFRYLDFSAEPTRLIVKAATKTAGLKLVVYLDDNPHDVIGEAELTRTNGSFEFLETVVPCRAVSGVHSVHVMVIGTENAVGRLMSIRFESD